MDCVPVCVRVGGGAGNRGAGNRASRQPRAEGRGMKW